MEGINFLPWREKIREEKKRHFVFILICAALLGLFIVIITHTFIAQIVQKSSLKIEQLQNKINESDANQKNIEKIKQKKQELIQKIKTLYILHDNSNLSVNLFNELAKLTPESIYLYQVTKKNKLITITGYAKTSIDITGFLKAFSNSKWFMQPKILQVVRTDNNGAFGQKFQISATIKMKTIPYEK